MRWTAVTDAAGLNQALFSVTHGLYILTAQRGEKKNGQCLDALMQVTNAPPRIVIGVGTRSLTHEMIAETGRFAFSVLDRDHHKCGDLIRHFGFQSGHKVDKFEAFDHELTPGGLPILRSGVAVYECTVDPERTVSLGTHSLFVASVDWAGTSQQGTPLTYNEYRETLRKERST